MKKTNDTLLRFRECFSRETAFNCFLIFVFNLMTRRDSFGIISTFRNFGLDPKHYCSLDHFFRADSWELSDIISKWSDIVSESEFAPLDEGELTFLLDGVKQSKEGRFMPGVKKLHQESENSGKG